MKIIKLVYSEKGKHYYAMFDEVPELRYEKIGNSYVGSAVDGNGNIIASEYLKYDRWPGAFVGRELNLTMKDGSEQKIKDYWYDAGPFKGHGEFIGIGAGTLKKLQRCFVFFSYNINKETFSKMVDDYLTRDRLYEYRELEEWAKLQYDWYDVVVNGKQIPYMMNEYGEMIEKDSKKRVFSRDNICRKVNGKYKTYTYFRLKYKENGRLVKIEASYLETLKSTLPFTEQEIREKCGLKCG